MIMKTVLKISAICIVIVFTLSSCYNTRILVGNIEPKAPVVEVNKEWNHHIIFGLVPLSNAYENPKDYLPQGQVNYVVKTNMSFLNMLVQGVTMGIYTPTQTKFYVPFEDAPKNSMK